MAAHEITRSAEGHQVGSDGEITVSLLGEGRMFKRRAIKPGGVEVCWLVAEIDGVRVYQQGRHVIVSKQDFYP